MKNIILLSIQNCLFGGVPHTARKYYRQNQQFSHDRATE